MPYYKRERLDSDLHPNRRGDRTAKEDIKQFGRDLNEAFQKSVPNVSAPYQNVLCLMLAWKHMLLENEGGVADEFRDLGRILSRQYHFSVEEVALDRRCDTRELQRQLVQLAVKSMSEEGCLVIAYYNGYGFCREGDRKFIISANRQHDFTEPREIELSYLEMSLNFSAGDVLYLIDSCYSASAGIDHRREVLAASAIEQVTDSRALRPRSFTRALCESLRSNPGPATVAQIHARLVNQWQNVMPKTSLQDVPIHRAAEDPNANSITLIALMLDGLPPLVSPRCGSFAKVLIAVKLESQIPANLGEWQRWLATHISANAHDAKIEVVGMFESASKLVLLNIPVALWDTLEGKSAYCFVDYVKSTNLLR